MMMTIQKAIPTMPSISIARMDVGTLVFMR
jgi:hypothetical protein